MDPVSTELDALRGVRLFASLPDGMLAGIAARAVPRTLRRGAPLFRRGEPCRGLHVVIRGRIEVYAASPDGREQILHRIGARQAVTELPLFDGGTYPASARAVTETSVLFIPTQIVDELCRAHPELLRAVVADLGRSVRRLTRLVEKLSLKDVRARVATLLLEQAAAHEALRDGAVFRLDSTQEAMAHALASTRESVARALAELRREGIVVQRGARIRIVRLEELLAVAEGVPGAARPHARSAAGAYPAPLEGPCC